MADLALLNKLANSQNEPGLSKSLADQIIVPPLSLSFQELMQLVKDNKLAPFRTKVIDLTNAQTTPAAIAGAGTAVYAYDATDDTVAINMIFSDPTSDPIAFNRDYGLDVPFSGLYATWSAQANKTISLMIIPISQLLNVRNNKKVSTISSLSTIYGLTTLPSGATEVRSRGIRASAGTNPLTIYTVTAAKTLYITELSLFGYQAAADLFVELITATSGGVYEKTLATVCSGPSAQSSNVAKIFIPPVQLAAGKLVRIRTRQFTDADNAACNVVAEFGGYEI